MTSKYMNSWEIFTSKKAIITNLSNGTYNTLK